MRNLANIPNCPQCQSEYAYEDGNLFVCPECAHEWTAESQKEAEESAKTRDVNGNELQDGDMVTIIKDLKVKGGSGPLKIGTKAKIRLVDGPNGHNLESKFDGIGTLYIKSEYVKKI